MSSIKQKRRVKIHARNLVVCLAKDTCIDPIDVKYVLKRLNAEGIPFLTRTLPQYSAAVLAYLETGTFTTTAFEWHKNAPRFLRGLFLRAINGDGSALACIRQFCDYFYKVAFSFSDDTIKANAEKYIAVDNSLPAVDNSWIDKLRKLFETHLTDISSKTIDDVVRAGYRPRYTPGAFSGSGRITRYCNHSLGHHEVYKRLPNTIIGSHPRSLNGVSGLAKAYPSSKEGLKAINELHYAELLFVPKDSRGPRVISKEPLTALKYQMMFHDWMCDSLTRITHKRVNFGDQTVNQELAYESSLTKEWATIDLKDASDRVQFSVVKGIFRNSPACRFFLRQTRTKFVKVPGMNQLHPLRKVANMGSGLCFPTLALICYLSAVQALIDAKVPAKQALGSIYVYGDDIICPNVHFNNVVKGLTNSGLLVNNQKSYTRSHFRESCGGDFFHGIDVAPARLKLPGAKLGTVNMYRDGLISIASDEGILQLERHCRELTSRYMCNTANYIYKALEAGLGIPLPYVAYSSVALGRTSQEIVIPCTSVMTYVPSPKRVRSPRVCPYKGLGIALRKHTEQMDDFALIPLRRKISLTLREVEPAKRVCYGTVTQV